MDDRELDRMGVGYFFENLSGNFKNLVSPVASLQDLHGVELYYNYAVTPWFRVTADLQVVDGVASRLDTAVIPGVRAQLIY
jgi:porin